MLNTLNSHFSVQEMYTKKFEIARLEKKTLKVLLKNMS